MDYVLNWFINEDKRLDKPKHGKIVTKNGQEIEVELMVSTLVYENFISYLIIIRDHTNRIETEKKLIEREAKYRRLFEDSSDALYITSNDGKLLEYNQTFKNLFELPDQHGEIVVTRFYQDVAARDDFIKRVLDEGSIRDHELNLITYKGKEIICLITTNVRYLNGEIFQLEGLLRDITSQKMQEKSLLSAQKLESLGLISSGIAHYFNNALMGILGSSSLLEKIVPEDKDVKSLLDIIKHSSNKVSLLVKQLLSYSGESTILNIDNYNISKIIESSLTLFEISVDGNVNLQTNLVDYDTMVEIDKQQIKQVLLNLVHNASEAIDHNDGEVIISTFFCEVNMELIAEKYFIDPVEPGMYGCVSVMDNGSGIPPNKLDRIFDPFYTTKFKGRGLGLAAVRGIVKSLKGHISVETIVGEGSIFTIYLPTANEK
jgi:PAS domain S-box-containing protein